MNTTIKQKFKNQNEMFNWIWENRPHISELTGDPLLPKGHFKWHWQFLHVLPKSYTYYKLNPDNILLGLPKEHENQNTYPKFNEKYKELRRQYLKEFNNKEFEEDLPDDF